MIIGDRSVVDLRSTATRRGFSEVLPDFPVEAMFVSLRFISRVRPICVKASDVRPPAFRIQTKTKDRHIAIVVRPAQLSLHNAFISATRFTA
jgi:hypothetical protein